MIGLAAAVFALLFHLSKHGLNDGTEMPGASALEFPGTQQEPIRSIPVSAMTIQVPADLTASKGFKEKAERYGRMSAGDPELLTIRVFVREEFGENRRGLAEWLGDVKSEDKYFLNAFREFGSLAIENGFEEEYHDLFERVSELQAVALFDGAVSYLAKVDPMAAFEYRDKFAYPKQHSRAQNDSYLIGQGVSNGKAAEVLEAVRKYVHGPTRASSISEVFYSWARYDPITAYSHLDSISDPSIRNLSMKRFFPQWKFFNPDGLAEWLESQSPEVRESVRSVTGKDDAGPSGAGAPPMPSDPLRIR